MLLDSRGLTLLEVTVGAVIGFLVAGGTMAAFVTATKISKGSNYHGDAVHLTQQTLERYRNNIAEDDPWTTTQSSPVPCSDPAAVWHSEALPAPLAGYSGTREYCVESFDCDGDGTNGDCFQVTANVHWVAPH